MFFKHHRNFSVARNLSHFLIMSPHNLCKYFIQLCEHFKCHLKLDDWFASVIMDALKRTPNTFITFECSPLDFWIIARKRNWLFIFKWFHNVRKKRVIMLQINSVMNSPRLHDTGLKYLFIFFFGLSSLMWAMCLTESLIIIFSTKYAWFQIFKKILF